MLGLDVRPLSSSSTYPLLIQAADQAIPSHYSFYYPQVFLFPAPTFHTRHFTFLIAGAVSVTWFALGVQAPNYIFVIREQYQTKPDICTSLILKKKINLFLPCYTMG